MIFSRLLPILLLSVAVAFGAEKRSRPTRPAAEPEASYKGAIAIDAATGNILFENNADIVSPPASMTKLMTFAVVHDALKQGTLQLDTPVKVSVADSKIGGTQVYLDPRETFTVEELIYAVMIQSANDAAHALARAAAGSVPAFVEAMNAKARELHMTNTTFRTPHGLPPATRKAEDGDLTSPRDFAKLSRYLLTATNVTTYTAVQTRAFGEGKRPQPMAMKNHNNLLGKVAGVDGLKTGFTGGAGFCLSATALRNGRRVIVVMMGSPQAKVRDLHVSEILERAFAKLPPAPTPPPAIGASSAVAAAPAAAQPSSPAKKAPAPAPAADLIIRPAPAPAKQQEVEPVVKFSLPKR